MLHSVTPVVRGSRSLAPAGLGAADGTQFEAAALALVEEVEPKENSQWRPGGWYLVSFPSGL